MLEIKEVTKKYKKTTAVDNLSFQIPDGKIGILLGPNGAGKSTVIKCIAGLLRYDGLVFINEIPARAMEAKKIFAYVPELPSMYESLTIWEHMEFIKRAYDLDVSREKMEEVLERFELLDKKEKLGNELSKGMMQKVSICCALIIKPKVMLLDEPMIGLDPHAIKQLKEIIIELKKEGTTVLVSTHMLDMVKDLWDHMIIINKGSLVGTYNKTEVENEDIESIFFSVTEGE
jgi:ABC-2 type transport system ATP-binding protein